MEDDLGRLCHATLLARTGAGYANLQQLVRPQQCVRAEGEFARRLADEGFNLLIEVGPKQVLTGLGKSLLGLIVFALELK